MSNCPLPLTPLSHSHHLTSLLAQTKIHISSADGRYLLDKGVSVLLHRLITSLREHSYPSSLLGETSETEEQGKRRLVDCLPAFASWSRGVWENIPDGGVEVSFHYLLPMFAGLLISLHRLYWVFRSLIISLR